MLAAHLACRWSTLKTGMLEAMEPSFSALLMTSRRGSWHSIAISTRSASSPRMACVSPCSSACQWRAMRPRILTSPSPLTVPSDSSMCRCPYARDCSFVHAHDNSDSDTSSMKQVPGVSALPVRTLRPLPPASPSLASARPPRLPDAFFWLRRPALSRLPSFLRRSRWVSSLASGAGPSTAIMIVLRGRVTSTTRFSRTCSDL
mmetsp:Transcript_26062/g.77323  ORF Transcript_26062/g.77323 Transcript_26062/m.77323 type:complete len:203 (-) Transcript_26062:417-1025(-)